MNITICAVSKYRVVELHTACVPENIYMRTLRVSFVVRVYYIAYASSCSVCLSMCVK